MTKTKAQLRAEAVERLKDTRMDTGSAVKKLAMAIGSEWNPPSVNYSLGCLKSRLIDLLTDDETASGTTNGTCPNANGTPSNARGDVVVILRKYTTFWGVSHATHTQCDSNWEVTTMRALADMVERDYVRHEEYVAMGKSLGMTQAERDYWKLHADCWADKCKEAEAERDEWKEKAELYERERDEFAEGQDYWHDRYGELNAAVLLILMVVRLMAERDAYREKLGRAVDAAHGIARMMEVE